jgi:DNA-binding response OmpR family regulator
MGTVGTGRIRRADEKREGPMTDNSVHFLLVEDDDDHAELITMGLEASNTVPKTIERVRDGEEALTYLKRTGADGDHPRPSLVLLDLKLPKLNGHEVLRAMKRDDELRGIPVVVLTTSQALEDRVEAYSCHANSYLTKPTDFGEFTQMIREVSRYWTVWNQRID